VVAESGVVVAEFIEADEPVVELPEVEGVTAESVAAGAAAFEPVMLPLVVSELLGVLALDEAVPEE
jgi:hypothetical protein